MLRSVVRLWIYTGWLAASPGILAAATLPTGFTESPVATGLSSPTAMAIAPDGRIFVCQQGGALRVIKNGALLPTPFLSLPVDSSGERGLLGVAFDPAFATNQFVYVYYTATTTPRHNRVSRFTASGDVALPNSEFPILDLEDLNAGNHNGGAIHFGPDGKLYVAVGENGNGSNSQSLSNRLGKMLRINANGTIPGDNPFVGVGGASTAIWARGLRNPYTFAFNPSDGRMFINDVGASAWEEINDGIAGANYGWPTTEGPHQNSAFVNPRYAYNHDDGCAITGAAFYSPTTSQFPSDYAGDYFFGDVCNGWIKRLDVTTNAVTWFATGISGMVDVLVPKDGSLYYLARGGGSNSGALFRVQYTPLTGAPPAPALTAFANSLTLSLSWTRSSGATSYRLEAGTASGALDLLNLDLGNVSAIEGVAPPGSYFARVRAVSPSGVSDPSNEIRVTLAGAGPCATPPPTPTGYGAQTSGLNVGVAWNASPSATFYVFEAGTGPGLANLLQASVGPVTSLAAAGLAGTYYTRVRAGNACGVSAPSPEAPVTLTCGINAPSGLRAVETGAIVTLSWTASSGATSYRVQVGSASGLSNLGTADVGAGTAISASTSGAPTGNYFVRIVATTPCGTSAASNEVIVTVP